MVFSSLTFLFVFLPLVVIVYFIMPSIKYRNLVLLIFSFIFYAWGEPVYIILMIISIINDYIHALQISYFKKKRNMMGAKIALISSIIINLSLLIIFKYLDFIIININKVFVMDLNTLNLVLPIGISFYTFQTMSYTIDVYRSKVDVQKNIITLGTYVALFPQLIAGPIVRYKTIEKELVNRSTSWEDVYTGISRFIIGLGKKVLIANPVGLIADSIFELGTNDLGFVIAWTGIIAYTLQIYYDFSGYSDMAIGLGKIFGFNYLENFRYPYVAQSITEFWRRWHISLGTWFRDYVYIPLGGNRVKASRWFLNIFIVWFLTGLWHGSSWNFIVWGLYYGVILIIEKKLSLNVNIRLPQVIKHLYTILIVMLGWVIFRTDSITEAKSYVFALFGGWGDSRFSLFYDLSLVHLLPFVLLGIVGATPLFKILLVKMTSNIITSLIYDIFLIVLLLGSILFLINNSFNPFIYFRF